MKTYEILKREPSFKEIGKVKNKRQNLLVEIFYLVDICTQYSQEAKGVDEIKRQKI